MAILDDEETLRGAIRELHDYALRDRSPNRPRRGIVFRVVSAEERHTFVAQLERVFGSRNLSIQEHIYGVPVGHLHIIDDSLISHVTRRHSMETLPGRVAVSADDYARVPEIVNAARIVDFQISKGMPRVVYARRYDEATITVVEEVQIHAALSVRTIYKNK